MLQRLPTPCVIETSIANTIPRFNAGTARGATCQFFQNPSQRGDDSGMQVVPQSKAGQRGKVREQQRYRWQPCGGYCIAGDWCVKESLAGKRALAVILDALGKTSCTRLGQLFSVARLLTFRWSKAEVARRAGPTMPGNIDNFVWSKLGQGNVGHLSGVHDAPGVTEHCAHTCSSCPGAVTLRRCRACPGGSGNETPARTAAVS
jgi:hypothetical protein